MSAVMPMATGTGVNYTALAVLVFLFLMVSGLGFWASRWRKAESMESLDEWGLGGRTFGTWITWFLLGGDLYTAYTFVALPALVFGVGALGFFAVPYTIVVYPLVFLAAPRLWSVAHRHGYVTPADFVRGRHGSATLALAIAGTGIVATMPYIALQLVGIEAVLKTARHGSSEGFTTEIAALRLAEQHGIAAPRILGLDEHDVRDVVERLRASGGGYEIVHSSPGIELGVYVLVAPEPDHQSAHDDDELYVVLGGRGELTIEGETIPLAEGQSAFVPAGASHRFTGYEGLSVLVVFARQHETASLEERSAKPYPV